MAIVKRKVWITESELYPVFGEGHAAQGQLYEHGDELEVDFDLWLEYLDAKEKFETILDQMDDAVNEAKHPSDRRVGSNG